MKGNGSGIRRIDTAPRVRMQKRFTLPAGCSAKSFTIRELDGDDEIMAGINAEKFGPAIAKTSFAQSLAAEQREKMYLSVVEVDGRRVNDDPGNPFRPKWNVRTMRFLEHGYTILNGVRAEEMASFEVGAAVVGGDPTAVPEMSEEVTDEPSIA